MTDDPKARGNPPEYVKVEKKKTNPLLYLLLALVALAVLVFLLSQCTRRKVETAPVVAAAAPAPAPTPAVVGTSTLPAYLAGSDPAPRTFTFERLHFDTAKSDIRAEDQPEVDAASDALEAGTSRVRIVGYADSTGSDAANKTLGMNRANAVKAAMVKRGVDAGRIDVASGGDANPVDTNATAGGRAENRRTELVVLAR